MNNSSACVQPLWSELLCCLRCKNVFSRETLPVNLGCGHLMCERCTKNKAVICPLDKIPIATTAKFHYINGPVLAISLMQKGGSLSDFEWLSGTLCSKNNNEGGGCVNLEMVEALLFAIAEYLYRVESEKGATVTSNRISRTIQRKLLSLLCSNVLLQEGRMQLMQTIRSMSERIVSELILHIQSNSNLSSSLWSAVRSRGCQFLGPGMQEDVLQLIRHALLNGESIARKTLVLFVVKTLSSDYPHISKTCVGHVVQLLYRASCFNVIKRDGQSSLMQLKEQFRDYDSLRTEHDAQIVQIAMEAGLRISPDQWSSLLYGDFRHRSQMQSVCDRLSTNSLTLAVEELRKLVSQQPTDRNLFDIQNIFKHFDGLSASTIDPDWALLEASLDNMNCILSVYSKFVQSRKIERERRIEITNECRTPAICGRPELLQPQLQPLMNCHAVLPKAAAAAALPLPQPPCPRWSPAAIAHPLEIDCHPSNAIPVPILTHQPPTLANYLVESSFSRLPMGSPPNFITTPIVPQMNMSPPHAFSFGSLERGDGLGGAVNSQRNSIDNIVTPLIPLLPVSPLRTGVEQQPITTAPSFILNPSSSPTLYTGNGPSIIVFGGSASGTPEYNKFENGTSIGFDAAAAAAAATTAITNCGGDASGTTLFSSSPPTYQIHAPQFSIPVQPPQPLILYGSTPPNTTFAFGSPPALFPHWVMQMETTANFSGLFGTNFVNNNNNNNNNSTSEATMSTSSLPIKQQPEELFDEQDGGVVVVETRKSSDEQNTHFYSAHPRASLDEDVGGGNAECHVSFTVATSVLSDEKFGGSSVGSCWTLELPSPIDTGVSNRPISPQAVKYAVARAPSRESGICAVIQTMKASVSSSLVTAAPLGVLPQLRDLSSVNNHLSISS